MISGLHGGVLDMVRISKTHDLAATTGEMGIKSSIVIF